MKIMMPGLLRSTALIALLLTGGCASLSENECRYGDWYDVGLRDGRQGQPPDRIGRHVKACGEHGIAPNHERYRDGHSQGLVSYCTRRNGFAIGQAGASYHNVCVQHDEEDFLSGYSFGKALHRARSRLSSVNGEIHRVEEKLRSKDLKDDEREKLTNKRIYLEGDRGRAQAELERLEWEAESF